MVQASKTMKYTTYIQNAVPRWHCCLNKAIKIAVKNY